MNNIIKYGSIKDIPLYNCSAHTAEEWSEMEGVKRPIFGLIDIFYGIVVNTIYVPILHIMFKASNFKSSCFKIMIFLGIVDMMAITVNSIITGFLAIQGAVFCSYPILIYYTGMAGIGLWCCSCIISLLLVFNRILYFEYPKMAKCLFTSYRFIIILLIPLIYGLYFVIFTPPIMFSSKYMTWFFDPMIFPNKSEKYENIPHGFNNLGVVAITGMMYLYFCIILCNMVSNTTIESESRKASLQLFIQFALICGGNMIASIIYVVMNFIEVPFWLIWFGHCLWQFGHGAPVLIYLTLNKTIKNGVFGCNKIR